MFLFIISGLSLENNRNRGDDSYAGVNPAAALTAAGAVLRMFDAMGRIFEDNCKEDTLYRGLQIDRKRRRKLREWKRARGIKSDGEELELR